MSSPPLNLFLEKGTRGLWLRGSLVRVALGEQFVGVVTGVGFVDCFGVVSEVALMIEALKSPYHIHSILYFLSMISSMEHCNLNYLFSTWATIL